MADPKVIQGFRRAAQRHGSPLVSRKALFAACDVESGCRNLNHGDRDSRGPLQQRPSQGWKNPNNPEKAAGQFLDAADEIVKKNPGISSAKLAQMVQRSAYPGRYARHSVQVTAERRARGGGSAGAVSGSRKLKLEVTKPGSKGTSPTVTPARDVPDPQAAALMALQEGAGKIGKKLPKVGSGSGLLARQQQFLNSGQATKTVGTKVKMGKAPTAAVTRVVSSSGAGGKLEPAGKGNKVIGTPYKGTHTLGNWQSDNAVDIAVPVGTPLRALQEGVVLKVKHHPQDGGRFAGDQITVKGANGNEYFYGHGSKTDVKPGQRIRKGQVLGRSGKANGVAHLHFGQRRGDPRAHTG